jgi:hypothetical protein
MEVCEMLDYLKESYNGSQTNMLSNSAYYCYTIKDTETGKFYSGSRGVEGSNKHDLLEKYFTSSTVVDFKEKLKKSPSSVEYSVEYFKTRLDAFAAEKIFHQKHQVGKNPKFINSSSAGGSNCGSGSVLCKDNNGNTYRVTVEEFSSGKHVHVSKGMMNIRTDCGIKKIYVEDFNPAIHTTEFNDYVLALNTETGNTCRIPKTTFDSDFKYVGITKGIVVAYDTVTNSRVTITQDEFNNSNGRYVGNTHGLVPVIDRITGEKRLVEKENYDKSVYRHHNSGNVVVYSISARKTIKISKEEYQINIDDYANQSTKVFYKVDNKFFKSKDLLDQYYRETRGKTVLKIGQFEMSKKFNDIETITKEEHEYGKN